MSKNTGFIPIRKGSKSIKNKNVKLFCGKPLVYWVIDSLEKSKLIDKIILASNIPNISEILSSYNFDKLEYFERSEKNAQDESSTESIMLEYINQCKLSKTDKIILTQATSPFTTANDFDKALNLMEKNNFDSIFSCVEFKSFLWDKSNKPLNYDFNKRPRRQDFNSTYLENGAFYISNINNIKKSKNRLSGKIGRYVMKSHTQLEIDEPDDWFLAENVMRKFNLSNVDTKIKYFFTDVDGVLTDSGMYYTENGDEIKKFNTRDGYAFEILKKNGIKTGIITGEDTKIVRDRAKKLNIDFLFQGVKNKLKKITDFCNTQNVNINSVAYIGDDINDYELLSALSHKACPKNAVKEVKLIPGIKIINKKGGTGAVRDFVEQLIQNKF